MDPTELERQKLAEIQAKLAAQQEGPIASPSVPFTRYVLEDKEIPGIHKTFQRAVYDKEIPLGVISNEDLRRLMLGYQRAEISLKNSRPLFAGGNDEDIVFSVLADKSFIKLSRARDGFWSKQLTTMTTVKRVETPGASPTSLKRSWKALGKKVEVEGGK